MAARQEVVLAPLLAAAHPEPGADASRSLGRGHRDLFDRILGTIPFKGQVLTQTARFWFEKTADICPNPVLSYPDPNVVVGRLLDILPVEIVVRDYLAGTYDPAARTYTLALEQSSPPTPGTYSAVAVNPQNKDQVVVSSCSWSKLDFAR